MHRPARKIDSAAVQRATTIASAWRRDTLRDAERLKTDTDITARLTAQLCVTCYYLRKGGIAGQAITIQPCGLCGIDQTYSSTATDVLCKPCADRNDLCKKCGADVDLQPNRLLRSESEPEVRHD